ncbi:MAG: flagellin [Thermodesulfobacteriota bacterium]|nr:flagellin [Thermodesulfobacteriota bacterium]
MGINTNIMSLNAQRNLGKTQSMLDKSLTRLSSGLRINSAKDDAAGLAIATRMGAQVRGLNQAARNANDGISLAQTAEGALQETGNILQRIRELAVQSANDTNTTSDRASLNAEVTQLKAELDRIAKTTAFNGKNVIDGTLSNATFQIGANAGEGQSISFSISSARAVDLGTAAAAVLTGTAGVAATATMNTDLVVEADTAGSAGNGITVGLFSDSHADVTETSIVTFADMAANADDTEFVNGVTATTDGASIVTDQELADGFLAYIADSANNSVTVIAGAKVTFTGTNDNTLFTSAAALDGVDLTYTSATANQNVTDIVVGGTGTPATAATTPGDTAIATSATVTGNAIRVDASAATIAGWTTTDVAALINGLTTNAGTVTATGGATSAAAFNNTNLAGGINESADYDAGTATVVVNDLSVASLTDAESAIASVDLALNDISLIRGSLGAVQNRFESTIANLQSVSENISAARSRIMDADFAAETADLTKAQVLQQAGVAMLAQANMRPQAVLSLLQ